MLRELIAVLMPVGIAVGAPPAARAMPPARSVNACLANAPEASARSGLGVDVVVRVMRAESGGDASAVSAKGAIGCMQIMPATWTGLSARHGLGGDPFDPRMT